MAKNSTADQAFDLGREYAKANIHLTDPLAMCPGDIIYSPKNLESYKSGWEFGKSLRDADWQERVIDAAILNWGEDSQIEMVIEECAELIVAIQKRKRVGGCKIGNEAKAKTIDEIADVSVMIRQMRKIFGEKEVDERIAYKIERLQNRLQGNV